MVARLLALVAAAAMVVAAIGARNGLDDEEENGASGAALRLVCDTSLAPVCEAVAGAEGDAVATSVEDAVTTVERLVNHAPGTPPPLDGWLVTAPWPGLVAAAQERAGGEAGLVAGDVLARSPVVMAVRPERQAPLARRCGGEITWKCVGEVAGTPWADLPGGRPGWGLVRPAHHPVATTPGLTVLGAVTVSYFAGRTDLSSDDFADGGFQDWLSRLERAGPRPVPVDPFQTMLVQPSAFDVVGTLEADGGPDLVTAARNKPVLLYPSPVVTADVVLAVRAGGAGERVRRLVESGTGRAALADAGWRVEGQRRAPGVAATPALPPASNLPDPDVLQALLSLAIRVAP